MQELKRLGCEGGKNESILEDNKEATAQRTTEKKQVSLPIPTTTTTP